MAGRASASNCGSSTASNAASSSSTKRAIENLGLSNVFRMGVLPRVDELQGFCSAILMIDRESGLAVSSVAFDDLAAIEASRDAAQAIRAGAVKEIGAEVLDVREHELILAHLHVPEMA